MNAPIVPPGKKPTGELTTDRSPAAKDPTFYLPKLELSRFVGALVRRGWIAVFFMLLAGVATWFVLDRMPKTYLSTGSVYISTQAPQFFDIQPVTPEESRELEEMLSVEQGMLSSTLMLRVIEKEGLQDDPTFVEPGTSLQGTLKKLTDNVKIALRRGTRMLDIAVEDTDPERARRLVGSIKDEYEILSEERQKSLMEKASQELTQKEDSLRLKLAGSEAELQKFRQSHPVPGLAGVGGSGADPLAVLTTRLTQAKTERLQLEAEREAFRKFDAGDPDALAGLTHSEQSAEVLTLVRELRDKELQFDRVKERYLHKHPTYKEAAGAVASLKESLGTAVRTAGEAIEKSYQVAVENESKLKNAVELASTDAVGVEGLKSEFAKLAREVEKDRELLETTSTSLRNIRLIGLVPTSILSWREQPLAPEKPYRPRKILLTPLAAMGGFCFGLLVIVGLELGDRRVRDTAAVSRATGVPLLARVPDGGGDGLVMLSNPGSEAAEAFRRLRAVLIPPTPEGNFRTVVFASARAGEGASFCALNHAVSLAVQGYRTLLVDADLRKPGLSRDHLGEPGGDRGLGAYLAGEATPAEACVRTPVSKLYLMSSGEMKSDAAELLSGTRFPALLEEAYRWFDRVVIDVPSVLATSDAQAVARYADRACLVVGKGGSDSHDLKHTADLLRSSGANLVGFVWNEHPASANGGPSIAVARKSLADEPVDHSEAPPRSLSLSPDQLS
ncbi:tyrosine-protein kinase capsular biosynthesis [Haloferula helveola]|uniref:Tyrosine-protein kinase capsular biosynthesis n=1 Tax=Haloferula helveola TaxID=490095 RepID=A0ABN6H0J5_9BACT|nr:tyrosine-protein kinase capsular biosynthesis [Haloferula helveola]